MNVWAAPSVIGIAMVLEPMGLVVVMPACNVRAFPPSEYPFPLIVIEWNDVPAAKLLDGVVICKAPAGETRSSSPRPVGATLPLQLSASFQFASGPSPVQTSFKVTGDGDGPGLTVTSMEPAL